jgi:6-hydroxycyclohex-1-ene-1-carbonyl-CoA dehydrogenase
MKAVRLTAPGAPLALESVPDPEPGPDQVTVRVAGCGVCHTDIGFWRDGIPTRRPLPLTLGHEVSGVVEAAGATFRELLGREVIVPAVIPCGVCELCRGGRGNACRAQVMPGNDLDGGFAEALVVPGRGLCLVEERGGYDLAELSVVADAVTTPYQAVVRSGLGPGGLAVVIGAGGVGGYAVQIAAALGARVVALDVDDAKLAGVAPHGASLTLNPKTTDFKSLKKEIAGKAKEWGCPAHGWTIFECSGTTAGQETAWGLLGTAGTLLVVGFTLGLDATVQGTWGCRAELYPDALRMVTTGRITLKPFIERHPLSLGPEVIRRVADHEIHRRAILVP